MKHFQYMSILTECDSHDKWIGSAIYRSKSSFKKQTLPKIKANSRTLLHLPLPFSQMIPKNFSECPRFHTELESLQK
jgi:hypothetical protein